MAFDAKYALKSMRGDENENELYALLCSKQIAFTTVKKLL